MKYRYKVYGRRNHIQVRHYQVTWTYRKIERNWWQGNHFSGVNSSGIKGLDLSLYSVVRPSVHSSTSTNLWGRTQGNIYTGYFRVLNISQSYSTQGVFVHVMLRSNPVSVAHLVSSRWAWFRAALKPFEFPKSLFKSCLSSQLYLWRIPLRTASPCFVSLQKHLTFQSQNEIFTCKEHIMFEF